MILKITKNQGLTFFPKNQSGDQIDLRVNVSIELTITLLF